MGKAVHMIDVFTLIAHQKTTGFDSTNPMDNDLCKLTAMFNEGEEGKARLEGGGHDNEEASPKFNTSIQRSIPYL